MESEKTKQFHIWLIYLAILLVSGIVLALAGGKGFTQRGKSQAMSASPRVYTIAGLPPDTLSPPPQLSIIKELSASHEWLNGAKAYVNRYVQPESKHYPPAGRAVPEDIRRLQQLPKPNISQFKSLIITGGEKVPKDSNYRLYVSGDGISSRFSCPLVEQIFGPIRQDGGNLKFQLIEPGWFSTSKVTEIHSLPVSQLKDQQPLALKLKVLDNFLGKFGLPAGQPFIQLSLQTVPFNPEFNSGEDGDPRTPKRYEAATDLKKLESLNGEVSFDGMDASDNLVILSPKRHLTLLVIGDGDLKRYVKCSLTNTDVIGAYADHLPLFAAAGCNWDSLRLHIGTFDKGQKLNYQVVALSGDEPTTKQIFLWFVGRRLLQFKSNGVPLSRQSANDTARWLMRVLDVTFSAQEVEGVTDPDVKALLTHFLTMPK